MTVFTKIVYMIYFESMLQAALLYPLTYFSLYNTVKLTGNLIGHILD